MTRRIPCVGAVVEHDGRFLLVLRGREPGRGLWSIPGGKVEHGESDADAVVREVAEETGLRVTPGIRVGTVERPAWTDGTYVIRDYRATLPAGTAPDDVRAGDDADEARWFTADELRALPTVPGLVEALEDWGVLP